ncbi:MAG: DsbE family thiol:disulfide interchange protein [Rhizobiales bacterium]|nr:DsbE family thiol:disulfide interchange protein [Hyphomicrobiales bacterium]NRB14588.1 DsbE family thiol:disulfide interchange protein [Hyphomicrobiales bacterium]
MKQKFKFLRLIPIIIFVGLAATFLYRLNGEDPSYIPSVLLQKPIPQFELAALGDLPNFSSADFNSGIQGDVKVVNFWASWCVACRAEHAELDKLRQRGIKIYGVNHKDDDGNALEFLSKYGNVYDAVGTNKNGRVGIDFGVRALPETFIIDQNGLIRFKQIGPILPGENYDNFVKQFQAATLPIPTNE